MEIKTIFNIGDIIWFIHESNIKQGKIYGIKIHNSYDVCLKTYEIKYYNGECQCNIELNENNIYKNQKSLIDELVLNSWKYEEQYDSFDDIEDKYPEIRKCYAYDDDGKVVEKDTIDEINEYQDVRINISKEDYEDFYRITFK